MVIDAILAFGFIKAALLLIAVLAVLILAHEAGHFVTAKMVGMRVDEFGFGYPPRLWAKKIGNTEYSINALPFGGFVRIYGEDEKAKTAPTEPVASGSVGATEIADYIADGTLGTRDKDITSKPSAISAPSLLSVPHSFVGKTRLAQVAVLLAGVAMNVVLAWVLIVAAFAVGVPRLVSPNEVVPAHSFSLAIDAVLPHSPASRAGLKKNDVITSATAKSSLWNGQSPKAFTSFISTNVNKLVTITVLRGNKIITLTAKPQEHVSSKYPNRVMLGFAFSTLGTVPLSLGASIYQGTALTIKLIGITAVGLGKFFWHIITFSANFSQVAGPVGIAGAVGTAASQGIGDLFFLVAVISINLAIINILPIPALDGGRLFIVLIEAVRRRSIPARITNTINTISFAILIILMVVITAHDIFRIVS